MSNGPEATKKSHSHTVMDSTVYSYSNVLRTRERRYRRGIRKEMEVQYIMFCPVQVTKAGTRHWDTVGSEA
jgi:hypothetical protein